MRKVLLSIFAAVMLVWPAKEKAAESTGMPIFEPDPLWSQVLPNRWMNGQVEGVAVDLHDNVWVFHRPATIANGEKAAALNPPQAECCIPAPPVLGTPPATCCTRVW
jgi:hypothetical protein